MSLNQGVPGVPQGSMIQSDGSPTTIWYSFFINLWNRTGGALANISPLLDQLIKVPGSIIYRGASLWQGLSLGQQYTVLRAGVEFPEWDLLDGNSFGPQTKRQFFASPTITDAIPVFRNLVPADFGAETQNSFLAAPASGGDAVPTFRAIASADLNAIAGQYPGTVTNDAAAAGNIGEYLFTNIPSGSAVPLTTATAADIATLDLTPGDWDVWANFVSAPAPTTTQSRIQAWIRATAASDPGPPNVGAYAELQTTIAAGLRQTLPAGSRQVSVAAGPNLTIRLSATVTFAVSTLSGYGFLAARRRR